MHTRMPWMVLGAILVLSLIGQTVAIAGEGLDITWVAFLWFPIMGAFIASRQPRNAIGWIMLGIGVVGGLSEALATYVHFATDPAGGSWVGVGAALALEQPLWVPVIGVAGTFLILLFPDGHLPTPAWRPWAYFCAAALILLYGVSVLAPGTFAESGYPGITNPLGVPQLEAVNDNFVILALLVPVTMLGSAVALIRRFRRSSGVARIQLRWLAAAGGLVAATYAGLAGIHLALDTGPGRVPRWLEIVSEVGILAFALVPISIGMAIVRYRLYDIDLIINRTLVYGVSTAALTAGYIVLVTVMQGLLRPFAGRSQLAVAGSTLIVAAAFKPVRDRVQSTVDRRFYRSKVDAEATVQTFSARLRDEVSLETLTADLLAVVDRTMKPTTSSLWLRSPDATPGGTALPRRERTQR